MDSLVYMLASAFADVLETDDDASEMVIDPVTELETIDLDFYSLQVIA